MPYNGAGTFTRLYSWLTDKANGVKIQADRVDAEMDGLAAGLSNVITRDGQTTVIADLPMNGKRFKNVGDPVDPTDVVNKRTHDLALPKAGGTVTGPIEISFATPYFDLVFGNVIRYRQIVDAGGTWILRNGDDGDNKIYVTSTGRLWTKELGYVGERIEARAADYAENARAAAAADAANALAVANAANTNANNRVAKTGDTMSGDLTISKAAPVLALNYPGVRAWYAQVGGDGYLRIWPNGASADTIRFGPGSDIYTAQLGDLNTRIEGRAAAFADDRAGYRVAKAGDTMTGDLTIRKAYPGLELANTDGGGFPYIDFRHEPYGHGDFTYRMRHDSGLNQWIVEYVGAGARFAVRADGSIWCAQLGDLNTRIETRANDIASSYAAARVAKTGDTMTGDLIISKAYPTLTMLWGGLYRSGWQIREDARTYLMELDTGTPIMSIGPGGDISTRQFGDLATRIEDRARVYAEDRIVNGYAGVLRDIGSNFAATGYFRLSNGLIFQWGAGGTSDTYVPFPVSFPTAVLHISGTAQYFEPPNNGVALVLSTDNANTAGFNARPRAVLNGGAVGQVSGVGFSWFAIGF